MSKFKVGDAVRILNADGGQPSRTLGKLGIVKEVLDTHSTPSLDILVEGESHIIYYNQSRVELIQRTKFEVEKQDLQFLLCAASKVLENTDRTPFMSKAHANIRDCSKCHQTFGDCWNYSDLEKAVAKVERMINPTPKETPEQIKVKELKATIEKAQREVAALERGM